jgi:hypothetical protein
MARGVLVATLRALTGEDPSRSALHCPRRDGEAELLGAAPYAHEHPVEHSACAHLVQTTVARSRITAVDTATARVGGAPALLVVSTPTGALGQLVYGNSASACANGSTRDHHPGRP